MQQTKAEWIAKMVASPRWGESRVRALLEGHPWDWDDNVPEEWAEEAAEILGIIPPQRKESGQ